MNESKNKNEDDQVPELPEIFRYKKTEKEEVKVPEVPEMKNGGTEGTEGTEKESKQPSKFKKNINSFKDTIEKTMNIDLYRNEIEEKIEKELKEGNVLLIGRKVGLFSEKLAQKSFRVTARDTSPTFISPKTEVKDIKSLEIMDYKPYVKDKLKEIRGGPFLNVVVLFALKDKTYQEQYELLAFCKEQLHSTGIMYVVDEFVPKKNIVLGLAKLIGKSTGYLASKIRKKETTSPFIKIEKLIKQLELHKYKTIETASGQIRTYILAKRLSAFLKK